VRYKIVWGLVIPLLYLLAGYFAAKASACDPGQFYDPAYQICAPYTPANQPGWGPRELR
jgi:hypothetical protein